MRFIYVRQSSWVASLGKKQNKKQTNKQTNKQTKKAKKK